MMKHLPTLLALCALTAFTATALAETPKQPNIVLLISDDDDYEHFGFMGSKIAQTPTLDKLVANGTLFTTAHCPAPLCRPSLASMLSGKLPNQHGIYGNYLDRGGIGNDTIKLDPAGSLANRLKDAGYATYASGKFWEGDPREMGFTHGTIEVTITGFRQFVREGQEELFQFIDDQHQKKPMFIWWAPLLPHGPYNPPPKYFDRFADTKIPIPSFYKGDRKEYVATMRKFYAMGTWFDDGVAQLIGRSAAAGNIAECSLAFEFCEHILLLSTTFQEANCFSDGATFVGNHAFIVVFKILRFEEIQLECSLDLPGVNRSYEQKACLMGPRLGFPLFLKRAAWPLASNTRPPEAMLYEAFEFTKAFEG